ncbi:MAG: hypothetical protein ACO363_01610 [Balneolaceae bacterium]
MTWFFVRVDWLLGWVGLAGWVGWVTLLTEQRKCGTNNESYDLCDDDRKDKDGGVEDVHIGFFAFLVVC